MEIKTFNRTFEIYFKHEAEEAMTVIEKLLESIDKPFVCDVNKPFNVWHFPGDSHWCLGFDLVRFLTVGKGENIIDSLCKVAELDKEWTDERNKDLAYTCYYMFTLKEETRNAAKEKLEEIHFKFSACAAEISAQEEAKKAAMKKLYDSFEVVKVFRLIQPTSGEDGYDGYCDISVRDRETGKETRIVHRNVFDFGVYCYPKRVEGTDDVLSSKSWDDDELKAARWVRKFSPLQNKSIM